MSVAVFPGQGSQFVGMGKDFYEKNPDAKTFFEKANNVLGFSITEIMFNGSTEELKKTKVTQPAIFIHSVINYLISNPPIPTMAAGHSLGEFSALTSIGALAFEDGLKLVSKRAEAMQFACDSSKGTMAAILGLDDKEVETICEKVDGLVVPANYNCPGQLVISGEIKSVQKACELLTDKGARRALILPVNGAFHSPLMEPAKKELEKAIMETNFNTPKCPIYQNVNASPSINSDEIKSNLILQLTNPVRWTQTINKMILDGAKSFTEYGPGKVLQGLIRKIDNQYDIKKG